MKMRKEKKSYKASVFFLNANDVFVYIKTASWFHLETSSIKPTEKINVEQPRDVIQHSLHF